jgi:signal transduction histidine kinase
MASVYVNTNFFDYFIKNAPAGTGALLWTMYLIMLIICLSGLLLLYKKPDDLAVKLFFIFLQCIITSVFATYLNENDLHLMLATVGFIIFANFTTPPLVHFMLIFPKPSRIIIKYKYIPWIFYTLATLFVLVFSILYIQCWIEGSLSRPVFHVFNKLSLWIFSISFLVAIGIAILQYTSLKDTFSRNQIRIVIIGVVLSPLFGIAAVISYDSFQKLFDGIFYLVPLLNSISRIFLAACILIAILRYRIWDIEMVIKKVLLYLTATAIIILSYLFLLYLVDIMTNAESKTTRFIALAIAVIIFLLIRDKLQRLIDRFFHRESYDSTSVVARFEEELSGEFRIEELGLRILDRMDKIFYFKSILICLKKEENRFEPAFVLGVNDIQPRSEFQINAEFENKLLKSKVFSPGELIDFKALTFQDQIDLVVPMIKDNEPFGFFLCGPKKSEKSYSVQDIRVLSLIAKRVVALFQTAALFQKDLDRQLMLERERARISQDMHDDIGASLTRISMMSEMVKNREDVGAGARQWLGQISGTSRGLMEEMNQIIWALNPKNDNVEGLITYIRRFAFEYLEPAAIKCHFDLPQKLQEKKLSVETRRNIYLVVREALHNVMKHSGARGVDIRLSMVDGRFSISIKDDGKGFDPGKLEFPGNGLVNMKKRMNDIGGEIAIKSEPGFGTEIELICFT